MGLRQHAPAGSVFIEVLNAKQERESKTFANLFRVELEFAHCVTESPEGKAVWGIHYVEHTPNYIGSRAIVFAEAVVSDTNEKSSSPQTIAKL